MRPGTISLSSAQNPDTAGACVARGERAGRGDAIIIHGAADGATTIDGGNASQVFSVAPAASVTHRRECAEPG